MPFFSLLYHGLPDSFGILAGHAVFRQKKAAGQPDERHMRKFDKLRVDIKKMYC